MYSRDYQFKIKFIDFPSGVLTNSFIGSSFLLKAPSAHLRHGNILGYYLGYKVANSSEPYRYQTLGTPGSASGPSEVETRNELRVDNLKKFTQYSVVIQAYNSEGAGPRNQEVVASTAEDSKTTF